MRVHDGIPIVLLRDENNQIVRKEMSSNSAKIIIGGQGLKDSQPHTKFESVVLEVTVMN